jgi:dTDP-4-dehydrorhamnose reductase
MESIQRLGFKPIVGLLHHGSGPRYTSLLDPEFPEKLASYAGAVARRYPWATDYTPVNEPLTTARFSCLYGHWYPHLREPLAFARALLLQCRAIVLAMRAIREVNPAARLVQTEDLGKTFSTPTLAYQAEFENERRWLTFDLLCGRVAAGTAMWDYFTWLGVERGELEWFIENKTSPDLLGVNHYVTSERFLDERIGRYPASSHGGNGQHAYADVEAVRVCAEGVAGPKAIMKEVWNRYRLPLAITEVHLGCTREEQLRWLSEVWHAALESREDKVRVRAVTAWAAFGTYDWDSLLTANRGRYEPGLFDLRSSAPRQTALGNLVQAVCAGREFDHPCLDAPGWWHRMERLCYPPVASWERRYPSCNEQSPWTANRFRAATHHEPAVSSSVRTPNQSGEPGRPILIIGATGTLGQAFARICGKRGLAYHLLSRAQLDIANAASVAAAFDRYEPWAIINAAGYVRVDDAESDAARCRRENVTGPECLARACAHRQLPLVTFSSDLVFDGRKDAAYVESDAVSPLNVYGASKAEAEKRVLAEFREALVIRTSAFFGPWDRYNFVHAVLDDLSNARRVFAADDLSISPTYVPDLVKATLDLLIDGESGIWHLANAGVVSWAEFARLVAEKAGYDSRLVQACAAGSLGLVASRPSFTALASERGHFMPSLEDSVDRFFSDRAWDERQDAVSARK